jgi:hypothetical protein
MRSVDRDPFHFMEMIPTKMFSRCTLRPFSSRYSQTLEALANRQGLRF